MVFVFTTFKKKDVDEITVSLINDIFIIDLILFMWFVFGSLEKSEHYSQHLNCTNKVG